MTTTRPQSNHPSLSNKTALITGGTSGIGLATAHELARRGARVNVVGRNQVAGREAAAQAEREGHNLRFLQGDVSQEQDVARLFEQLKAEGPLDILVASHGTLGQPGPVADLSLEAFRQVLEVNLVGTFSVLRSALPLMTRGGSVVLVSSTVGAGVSFPGTSAYAASKAGVIALAETVALEVAGRGIRVNALLPGGVDTPMFRSTMGATEESAAHVASLHALGRVGRPSEIAAAAAFLASDEASFVTGASWAVDGGMRVK